MVVHGRARALLASTAALLGFAIVLAGCGGGAGEATRNAHGGSSHPTTSTSLVPSTTTTFTPTALTSLQSFFTAASDDDAQLRSAAAAINGGITPTTLSLTKTIRTAITAANPQAVGELIPAGANPTLTAQLLLAFSDLVSRYLAMARYELPFLQPTPASPTATVTVTRSTADLTGPSYALGCLANGATAAADFPGDMAAAERTAAGLPPIAPAAANSATAASIAVWVADIWISNSGCLSCGGQRYTTVPTISWTGAVPPQGTGPTWYGTLRYDTGGYKFFHVTWARTESWQATIMVC